MTSLLSLLFDFYEESGNCIRGNKPLLALEKGGVISDLNFQGKLTTWKLERFSESSTAPHHIDHLLYIYYI